MLQTPPPNNSDNQTENPNLEIQTPTAQGFQFPGIIVLMVLWIIGSICHFFYLILPPFSFFLLHLGVLFYGISTGGILTYNYFYNLSKSLYITQIVVFSIFAVLQSIIYVITIIIFFVLRILSANVVLLPMIVSFILTLILLGISVYKLVTKAYELEDTEEIQLKKRIGTSGAFLVVLLTAELLQLFVFLVHEHQMWVSVLPITLGVYAIFISIGSFIISSLNQIKTTHDGYYRLLKFEMILLWILFVIHTVSTVIIGILLATIDQDIVFLYSFLLGYLPFSALFSTIFFVICVTFTIISSVAVCQRKSQENTIQIPKDQKEGGLEPVYDEI